MKLTARIERLNIVKVSVLPNLMYSLIIISTKSPANYFVETDKLILELIWRGKKLRRANTKLKSKVGRLTLPDFKTYYKATVIQTLWYW